MSKKETRGRKKKEPTVVMSVPVDRIDAVSHSLMRDFALNQTAIVKIRVPISQVEQVKRAIRGPGRPKK